MSIEELLSDSRPVLSDGAIGTMLQAVTKDQLEARAVQSLTEALRYVPGVQTSSGGVDPRFDLFNLMNANTADSISTGVGATYLVPQTIVAPRVMKVGFSVNF